jgi:hypothetical protein
MTGSGLDHAAARAIAERAFARLHGDLVVLDAHTVERPLFWVFFATTRLHAETGDLRHQIPGIGPLAVEKATGRTTAMSTSVHPTRAIEVFEQQLAAR